MTPLSAFFGRNISRVTKRLLRLVDIVKRVDGASTRAKRLRQPRLHDLPENHNPCSELHKLVNSILAS